MTKIRTIDNFCSFERNNSYRGVSKASNVVRPLLMSNLHTHMEVKPTYIIES
jgi:hypothetical protein